MANEKFIETLQRTMANEFGEMNTCKPGKVISYNADTNRAVVKPDLPKPTSDGGEVLPPELFEVPVLFFFADVGGQQCGLTFPLKPGDGVVLFFSDRSLENWLGGSDQSPDDPRQFDLTDALAFPALNAKSPPGHAENVRFFFGEASFEMTPQGKMIFNAPGGIEANTPQATFSESISSPRMQVDGKELKNHKHTGVQSGGSTTGPNVNG